MFEATANEFPFVDGLPKREKGRVAKMLDQIKEFTALQKQHGALVPASLVQHVLGVSKQRVQQLIDEGKLVAIQHHGRWFIPELAFQEFVNTERKSGRPFKMAETNKELWKAAVAATEQDSGKKLPNYLK